jgi:pimeloyl-ACP methyl ester carboxylesterase
MKLLLIVVAAYAVVLVVLYLMQDRMVFPGAGHGDRGLPLIPRMESGVLLRPGGEEFRIVTVREEPVRGVLVFFVGNGEDLYSGALQAQALARYGLMVIVPEYPGYGGSDGAPGKGAILECADATLDLAVRRARELGVPLLCGGSSLGCFPAVHLATKGGIERLLLRAPATTLADAARGRFWWLPLGWLLRHDFDNLALAEKVRCPVLVVHGEQDQIVPLELGRRLAQALPRAELLEVPGHGHNDLDLSPEGPVGGKVAAFLAGR